MDGGTITADEIVEALLDESEQYVREICSRAEKPTVAVLKPASSLLLVRLGVLIGWLVSPSPSRRLPRLADLCT
jgi:hypothetical protein